MFHVFGKRVIILSVMLSQVSFAFSNTIAEKKESIKDSDAVQLWEELDIVPMPKQIKLTGQTLPLNEKDKIVLVTGEKPCRQSVIGYEWINDRIKEKGGAPLTVVSAANIPADATSIIIGTKEDNTLISKAVEDGLLNIGEKNPGERGYEIKIDGEKIYLGGADPIGALYACVTFGELIQKQDPGIVWKEATVRDWPDTIDMFTLMSTFTTDDIAFPKIPKKITEETKKEYLEEVKKFHEYLLRRKFTGVNYRKLTLKGEKFTHAPWMDLVREGIENGKERGIGAMIYAETLYPGLIKNYPELLKETDKLTKGIKFHSKWIKSWSFDEARQETARNLAEYVRATGFTHVGFHDTDAGGLDNPSFWNFRSEFDKKRWGDDYTAATIHIHKAYYDELKKLNPDLKVLSVFYPYITYIFDAKAFENIMEQAKGKNANAENVIKMYQQKYGDFWKRINDAFPLDDIFCARESTWDSVVEWRKFIGNERGILWWNAVGSKYWEPIFSQGPSWASSFTDNIRNIIFVAYADQQDIPLNILAIREYTWNRSTPGATDFQPFYGKFTDYWKYAEPEGDVYSVVLPKVARNIFGAQASPYIVRAASQNIDINQALGRVRSSTYDLLNSPERRQWVADNAESAAAALNELWNKCVETKTQMGMDDRAFRTFIVLREAVNACKWYSKTKAQIMFSEAFAEKNEIDKAKKALTLAKEFADAGIAMMKQLVAERPEMFKEVKPGISSQKVMADKVDFSGLLKEIASLNPAKIAENNAKNKLIIDQISKRSFINGFLIKNPAGITIDGKIDEPVWSKAQPIDGFAALREKKLANAFTRAKIVRDTENLYISWTACAPPGEKVNKKDTIDIFINTAGANDAGRFEIFVSANGNIIPEKDDIRSAVKVEKDFWTGEIMIPLALLCDSGEKTPTWTINICRNCVSEGNPTEISSILPPDASNTKRAVDKFLPLRFNSIPANIPNASINVKDFNIQTVTLPDRIASVASFHIAIDSNIVLNKAVLSAETYGPDGKLQRTRELAVFNNICMKEEPKTLYEAEFTEIVEKGGILLKLESVEGTFTHWFRFGGWEGTANEAAI